MMIKELKLTRKKNLLGAVVICALMISGLMMWYTRPVAEAAVLDPHPGLVGWWRFDEGTGDLVEDSSGSGNHGSKYGATWVTGKYGNALSFDGIDDYVSVTHASSLTFTSENFTIAYWIKLGSSHDNVHLCKGSYSIDGWYIEERTDGAIDFYVCQSGATEYVRSKSGMLTIGSWLSIVVVKDGNRGAIYFDGVDQTFYSQTLSNPATCSRSLYIGRYDSAGYETNGILDEVHLYNRTLSVAEIQEIFQQSPDFSSKLLAKVPKGATQVITTLSWQGTGNINVTLQSPSENYTEDIVLVYQKTAYSTSDGTSSMLNIKRLSILVSALSADENWYVVLELDKVEDYRITVEVQK